MTIQLVRDLANNSWIRKIVVLPSRGSRRGSLDTINIDQRFYFCCFLRARLLAQVWEFLRSFWQYSSFFYLFFFIFFYIYIQCDVLFEIIDIFLENFFFFVKFFSHLYNLGTMSMLDCKADIISMSCNIRCIEIVWSVLGMNKRRGGGCWTRHLDRYCAVLYFLPQLLVLAQS